MDSLADLKLPHLAMDEPGFGADPAAHFASAREQHPWLAKCAFGYVVHDYSAIKDLMWMDDKMHIAQERLIDLMDAHNTPWGRFQAENIFALSGDAHKRIRDTVAPAFTPRQANLNRGLMRRVIAELLDEWVPRRTFDFEEFASHFPIAVMCSLVGAPRSAIPRLRSSMEAIGLSHSLDRSLLPSMQDAIQTLDNFCRDIIEERREGVRPGDDPDLLDALLKANDDGGLTDRELIDLLITVLVGGYDTSKNLLTMIMYILIDRPDDYERCAQDVGFCRKVVEETLRYRSISTAMRETTEDIVYRDVLIPEGSMLFFALPIALRNPSATANADAFDPERSQDEKHMAFGRGIHLCLGQYIARAQIEEGLHLIAQRLANPKTSGPMGWRPFFGASGIAGLPLEFTPAPARPLREATAQDEALV
jgi:cytochrome P450